jgi:hypothetical protein
MQPAIPALRFGSGDRGRAEVQLQRVVGLILEEVAKRLNLALNREGAASQFLKVRVHPKSPFVV